MTSSNLNLHQVGIVSDRDSHAAADSCRPASDNRPANNQERKASQGFNGNVPTSSYGFTVLTLLSASVSVCWMPTLIFYSSFLFLGSDFGTLYHVSKMLQDLEPVLDPIFFLVAIPLLRTELYRLFGISFQQKRI